MLTLNLNLLYTVVNVLILFLLLRKFLYKPVMGIIAQRQKQVDDALNAAETSKKEAAAEAERQHKLREADAQTTALARAMCEKLLSRNLTEQDDSRLLDDLLEKAGAEHGN